MKNETVSEPTWWQWILILAIPIAAFILFDSCSQKIVDAHKANLVSYEKKRHSSEYVITVMPEDTCIQYVFYWNSHKWRGRDAVVPKKWNVVTLSNKKSYSEPIK